ncbi:MAG: c-type cytochrome [Pirellulaceae bacterium]|nr:c-type cytochrome [Pirellulaceae bacterium]
MNEPLSIQTTISGPAFACRACIAWGIVLAANSGLQADSLKLEPGDRICIIGNTLAERMQHDGWLETLIQHRFPQHQLVFRNLGFSADELTVRLRSSNFGSPDDHLTRNRADVVFAFFGYNESFAGESGLPKFKSDLAAFVRGTLGKQYNGRSAPRLVLFSPIAHENLGDPNLPDGRDNNARLAMFTAAMADVAAEQGVLFIDLFAATQRMYQQAASGQDREGTGTGTSLRGRSLTINGIHLNTEGNRLVAQAILEALFPDVSAAAPFESLEKLRAAVLDKNFYWFHRYRTTDGYSIFGGRAGLTFVDGQTNREVMQREMEVLDVMTANRDRRIWAVAAGGDLQVDDSNTPPFIPVKTNKPGPLPDGRHVFLGGEEAIGKMTVAAGMQVNLFASEEDFPVLVNPVQMAFDTRGRLWVCAWPSYPHWKPKDKMNDKLLILEDTDGDGRADKCQVFADGLHNPTGFEFYGGGVIVAMVPDILFLKDTTGDDRADYRERILHGIDSADTHHSVSSFTFDPGGALYLQEGTFHHTQVETPHGPPARSANAGVFRYEPKTGRFEVYAAYGFANPHGHVFDRWARQIIHDGTGAVPYDGALISGNMNFPQKHAAAPSVYNQRTRPCPATEILSSQHFPPANQGNLLVANVIGFQGILQYEIREDGASIVGGEVEPVVSSSDPNFRPVDLEIGPDGALYFTDWQNPVIGHMQHNLRDPSRDTKHGRVYRVTYPSRPLLAPPPIADAATDALVALLKDPNDRVRYRAKLEMSARDAGEVIAAVHRWLGTLDPRDPDYSHQLTEALWMHQYHNIVDTALLDRVLEQHDHRARAAAVRVLCCWRDRIDDCLDRLKRLADDDHPRVRLEAVRAASFFTDPSAVEVAAVAAQRPMDASLQYVYGETMKTIEPYWKKALSEGMPIAVTTDAGARFFLKNTSLEQLLAKDRSRAVNLELLFRDAVPDEHRQQAVEGLAAERNVTPLRVLLDALRGLDTGEESQAASVVFDLVRLLIGGRQPAELAAVRDELEQMALEARQPVVRQAGFVAILLADRRIDQAWQLALTSAGSLRDLLTAMPVIPDVRLRDALYPNVLPLLQGLPEPLAMPDGRGQGSYGRFVRVGLSGRRTLTLAEVEVYSEGRNVARQGRASQKNTAHGGDAARGIDGNTHESYGSGGQTHTEENTSDPWWEVDLGEEFPVDSIVVYNRIEGSLGDRLDGFTLRVLDAGRNEVFRQEGIPAPKPKAEFALAGGGPEGLVRRAAMNALTSVRGQEAETFRALARFVREDIDRPAAIRAIQRLPRNTWPADEARPLLDVVLAPLGALPDDQRTTPSAMAAMEFADALASLLPADDAQRVRKQLRELGVQIVRIGTVPHRMVFDRELIAIQAGRPVEFLLENTDIMPHNLAITVPGSLEEIGMLAEETAAAPDAIARGYVPRSNKVLLASRLLQPRETQRLPFTAPTECGVYPYVCTYPGHWRRMYGALYVVADLDAYLADPEGYLAAHPLEIRDALLRDHRPRTEWKLEDLADRVAGLGSGEARSYASGQQIFKVANCLACHKMDGQGQEVGPDLTKLNEEMTPLEIAKHTLEPSLRIDEKYQSYLFELANGRVLTGMIVEETDRSVKILENPLLSTTPLEIRSDDIEYREKSSVSTMPKGLLDKLTRDEILDLIAYVAARGDRGSPLVTDDGQVHQHGSHQH